MFFLSPDATLSFFVFSLSVPFPRRGRNQARERERENREAEHFSRRANLRKSPSTLCGVDPPAPPPFFCLLLYAFERRSIAEFVDGGICGRGIPSKKSEHETLCGVGLTTCEDAVSSVDPPAPPIFLFVCVWWGLTELEVPRP